MNIKYYHRDIVGSMCVELKYLLARLDRYDDMRTVELIFTKSDFEWSLYERR